MCRLLSITNELQAVQRTATLRSLSRILASHDPSDTSCLGTEKCELCVNYITGLTTLYNCADEWVSTSRPFADMSPWTTRCLRSMPPATQRNFDDLLSHLLGDGWAKEDAEYQVTGDSEILAVLWALQVGPHGLLKGMTAGRDILSVLMDAEAAWVMENVDTEDLESKVKILTEFAGELCEWGRGLASKS